MDKQTETKIKEFCEYNGYIGRNLHRIAETLDKINWNLGVIANPELKKKYSKTEEKFNSDSELKALLDKNGNPEN